MCSCFDGFMCSCADVVKTQLESEMENKQHLPDFKNQFVTEFLSANSTNLEQIDARIFPTHQRSHTTHNTATLLDCSFFYCKMLKNVIFGNLNFLLRSSYFLKISALKSVYFHPYGFLCKIDTPVF